MPLCHLAPSDIPAIAQVEEVFIAVYFFLCNYFLTVWWGISCDITVSEDTDLQEISCISGIKHQVQMLNRNLWNKEDNKGILCYRDLLLPLTPKVILYELAPFLTDLWPCKFGKQEIAGDHRYENVYERESKRPSSSYLWQDIFENEHFWHPKYYSWWMMCYWAQTSVIFN